MEQHQTLFFGAPKSLQMVTAAMKLKDTPWKESYDQPRWHTEKQRHYFVNKGSSSQGYGFSSSHVWMRELDDKETCEKKSKFAMLMSDCSSEMKRRLLLGRKAMTNLDSI